MFSRPHKSFTINNLLLIDQSYIILYYNVSRKVVACETVNKNKTKIITLKRVYTKLNKKIKKLTAIVIKYE